MKWTHTFSMPLPAAPDAVFRALTNPEELTRWFAEGVDVALEAGRYRFWGRHTLGGLTEKDARQAITNVQPGEWFSFSWPLYGAATGVTLSVAPDPEGARITVEHHINGDPGVTRAKELIDDHWRLAFGNLASHLAGGAGILLPDYTDPAPEVRLTITIDAPPAVVFRALIEPDAVNRWFGTNSAVVEPRAGGRYELGWRYKVDGKDVEGGPTRILEIEPNRKLVLDWPDWRGDKSVSGQTIAFLLEPEGNATRLTFVHAGFGRTSDISDYGFGWPSHLAGLKVAVEQGGEVRSKK